MLVAEGVDKTAMACGCLVIRRAHRLKKRRHSGAQTLWTQEFKIQAQLQVVETRLKMGQKLIFSDGSEGHYRHQKASPGRTNDARLTVSLCLDSSLVPVISLHCSAIKEVSLFSHYFLASLLLFISSLSSLEPLVCNSNRFLYKLNGILFFFACV